MTEELHIRAMRSGEIEKAVELAALEGWNPGLGDAAAFGATDPEGFLIGELAGEMVGCISAVSYPGADDGGRFGFIGFYIVLPAFRGQGLGIQLWRAGMTRLDGHNVGLDGVVAQQENYRRSGFRLAYGNQRYAGRAAPGTSFSAPHLLPLHELDTAGFDALCRYDRLTFPAERSTFLHAWLAIPEAKGFAYVKDGSLTGYGLIRPASTGWKVGPLVADTPQVAHQLLASLVAAIPEGEVFFLDVPLPNLDAVALATELAMEPVFETARMYTGATPRCDLGRLYGVTSFELG